MRRLFFFLLLICQFFSANTTVLNRDSLRIILGSQQGLQYLVSVYQLGEDYLNDFPDSTIYCADEILSVVDTCSDSLAVVKAYYLKGQGFYRKSDYLNSIKNLKKAITYCDKSQEKEKADCYNVMGNSLTKSDNYKLSLSSYFSSLHIRNSLGDSLPISASLNNIGNVFFEMEDYKKALEYYEKSMSIKEKQNDVVSVSILQTNLGNVYHKLNNEKDALSYYMKALNLIDKEEDLVWKSVLLENIGQLFLDRGEISKCLDYYQLALNEAEKRDDKVSLASVKSSLAIAYLKKKEYDIAVINFEEALSIAKDIGMRKVELDCYYYMSDLYVQTKNYKKSIAYFRLYDDMRARINKENNSKEIAEFQAKFQAEKMDAENEILKQKNIIQKLELHKQKSQNIFLVCIGLLIISLLIYLIYITRVRAKLYKILSKKNAIISENNNSLTKLIATKDKFLSIIAHDLKNPFNTVLGFTDLIIYRFDELDDEKRLEYIKIVNKSALQGSLLLNNLLTWSRSQMGVLKYNPQYFAISEIVQEELEGLEGKALTKGITLHLEIIDNLMVSADPNMIRTVLRNLGNNAIKFTKEKGRVVFSIRARNGKAIISVKDNGIGLNINEQSKLFHLDSNHSRPGTMGERGTGLGLILCKDFVEKNGGQIGLTSQEDIGSEFWFSLSLSKEQKKSSIPLRIEEAMQV
ncbi:tetratricopeptide repeat protein [Labilibaculum sp.]|uniref:ATP-binding protein n=1 Tax=Labilibaculum sp. TaxID=2060723 RepID=UPI0035674E97